jgi:hypothetical protein
MITFTNAMNLTEAELKELSGLHGKLHRTELCGTGYLFRRVYGDDWKKLEDFRELNPTVTKDVLDEKLVDICLVGPKPDIMSGGWSNVEAGVLPTLAMLIRAKSGFIVADFADQQLIDSEDLSPVEDIVKPTEDELAQLRSNNKFKLKGVRLEDLYVVLRPLTRIEWKMIQKQASDDADKVLCEKAVLWPENIKWDYDYPVGYTDTLSQAILNISGFKVPEAVEDI